VLGDLSLFRAYVELGPRLSSLVMASAPAMTAVLGYVLLDETLDLEDALAMALIGGGIALAVGLRPRDRSETSQVGAGRRGILLAFGGAVGQAVGLVLSKIGMGDGDPFAATQIRVLVALAFFLVIFSAAGWWGRVRTAARDRKALALTATGATFGPFLGVSLSLTAVQLAPAGIAASLMATTPLLLLPIVAWRGERIGVPGVVGALVAVAGVSLLVR
jgi:uncharacterized membrane protein